MKESLTITACTKKINDAICLLFGENVYKKNNMIKGTMAHVGKYGTVCNLYIQFAG